MTDLEKVSLNVIQCINYKNISDDELKRLVATTKGLYFKFLNELNHRIENN